MEENPPGPCCRFLRKIGFLLLFLIVLPFILVFATPVACCAMMYKCCCDDSSCLRVTACLLTPFVFALGLALDPITIPIIILGGIGFMIYFIVIACLAKKRKRRQAEARIK